MDEMLHPADVGDRSFSFGFYPGSGKPKHELELPVSVLSKESAEELSARVANYHNIPCFVRPGEWWWM